MMASLLVTEQELPEAKNWKSGKEYDLILRVKMLPDARTHLKFNVLSVEAPGETEKLNENDFTAQKIKRLEEKSKEYS